MRAIDHAAELGKRRFLIELPTGMGKTDLICLAMKRLMQAGRAERTLPSSSANGPTRIPTGR